MATIFPQQPANIADQPDDVDMITPDDDDPDDLFVGDATFDNETMPTNMKPVNLTSTPQKKPEITQQTSQHMSQTGSSPRDPINLTNADVMPLVKPTFPLHKQGGGYQYGPAAPINTANFTTLKRKTAPVQPQTASQPPKILDQGPSHPNPGSTSTPFEAVKTGNDTARQPSSRDSDVLINPSSPPRNLAPLRGQNVQLYKANKGVDHYSKPQDVSIATRQLPFPDSPQGHPNSSAIAENPSKTLPKVAVAAIDDGADPDYQFVEPQSTSTLSDQNSESSKPAQACKYPQAVARIEVDHENEGLEHGQPCQEQATDVGYVVEAHNSDSRMTEYRTRAAHEITDHKDLKMDKGTQKSLNNRGRMPAYDVRPLSRGSNVSKPREILTKKRRADEAFIGNALAESLGSSPLQPPRPHKRSWPQELTSRPQELTHDIAKVLNEFTQACTQEKEAQAREYEKYIDELENNHNAALANLKAAEVDIHRQDGEIKDLQNKTLQMGEKMEALASSANASTERAQAMEAKYKACREVLNSAIDEQQKLFQQSRSHCDDAIKQIHEMEKAHKASMDRVINDADAVREETLQKVHKVVAQATAEMQECRWLSPDSCRMVN